MNPFCPNLTAEALTAASAMYASAKPYSHVILDGWFATEVLDHVELLFHSTEGWQQYEDGKRGKSAGVLEHSFFQAMNGRAVLDLIRIITGEPVVSDPTMRGAGLHVVPPGGRLGIHVDFNRHPNLPLARRVNTILYMNRLWDPAWQGALTLTNRQGCDQHIQPLWNRWVIFKYGPESWHGHPEPLACPPSIERRSIAMYYYTPLEESALAFTGTHYA